MRNPLRRSCVSSVRNAGENAICPMRAQPSAEIARVECAKCRRECNLSHARATLCGDRARQVREMQARVRFVRCPRNPLRRSCVSSARNAGENAIFPVPAQPSAEIVRVDRAKCRRESYKSVPQEFPMRVSLKSVRQECPIRVSCKSVPQECPASDPQECPTRISYKSVPQECPASDPQECPTRVSHKSVPQECPTRVSHKSVL